MVGGKISTIPGMYVLYLAAVEISLFSIGSLGEYPARAGQFHCIIKRSVCYAQVHRAQMPDPATPTSDLGSRA